MYKQLLDRMLNKNFKIFIFGILTIGIANLMHILYNLKFNITLSAIYLYWAIALFGLSINVCVMIYHLTQLDLDDNNKLK